MKYKDIARQILLDRGAQVPIEAHDGVKYNPSGREFTEKQLAKLTEHHDATRTSLMKKWKLGGE